MEMKEYERCVEKKSNSSRSIIITSPMYLYCHNRIMRFVYDPNKLKYYVDFSIV